MVFELLVLTYNIRCAAGPDGQKEWRAMFLPEIAADIRAVDPDIAGIQEIDQFSKVRSFNRDLPAELGSLTSRNVFFAPARDYDFVSRTFFPKIKINEDPVCGSAHCNLIPYWSERLHKDVLTAYQASPRGGVLYCENKGDRVLIRGHAVLYSEAELHI